jgi:hypothetical protein
MPRSIQPKRAVTRIRVNALPSVLSRRPLIPISRPFQPPPNLPVKAARAAEPWKELADALAPRRRKRPARSADWTPLLGMAAAAFVGFAVIAWCLGRPKGQPPAQLAQAPISTVQARQEPARVEPARVEPARAPQPPAPAAPEATAPLDVLAPAKAVEAAAAAAVPVVQAAPPAPPPAPPAPAEPDVRIAAKPEACAACAKAGAHGTSLTFAESPTEAAKQALKENKIMFVVHISGNFEDDKFT